MFDERPTAAELVAAVAEFLDTEVCPALEGRLAFHATVAVNVLRIVERELAAGTGDAHARLRALTGADGDLRELNALLAQRIRDGELSIADEALRDHLVRDVLARLAVDNPGYPSIAEAARYWPPLP